MTPPKLKSFQSMQFVNLADYRGQFGIFHWRMLLDDERNEIRIAFCWKSAKIGSACLIGVQFCVMCLI